MLWCFRPSRTFLGPFIILQSTKHRTPFFCVFSLVERRSLLLCVGFLAPKCEGRGVKRGGVHFFVHRFSPETAVPANWANLRDSDGLVERWLAEVRKLALLETVNHELMSGADFSYIWA